MNRTGLPEDILETKDLQNLTDYEQSLYYANLVNDPPAIISKLQRNWGIIVFKPPRASLYLMPKLRTSLLKLLDERNLTLIDSYRVKKLTKKHIQVMYPGDSIMPYWCNLEDKLINQSAYYFLISSNMKHNDILSDIELIKGWYKPDIKRGRLTTGEGLRLTFRRLIEETEGYFEEIPLGSEKYEDSGIHAPCSLRSRFLQLLGFMAVDVNGSKWARLHLEWLKH